MENKISVIIPVYNVEKYIERCFDSIMSQTYQNFEVIVINDGSTDLSLELCKKYEENDERFHVFTQENQGVSSARNLGLSKINGDYVCFIDADDYISSYFLEYMMACISTDNADIAICDSIRNGKFDALDQNKHIQIWDDRETIIQLLKYKKFSATIWGKIYRVDIIKDIRFDKSMRIGEDQIYLVQAIEKSHKIIFSDKKLYFYTERESSAMVNAFVDNKYWDSVRMAEWYMKQSEIYPDLSGLFRKKEVFSYIVIVLTSYKFDNDNSRNMRSMMLQKIKTSRMNEFREHCSREEKIKYVLVRYMPVAAKISIKVKSFVK